MADYPLQIGGFGNALAAGAQAGYATQRSGMERQQMQRQQDALQYVPGAAKGDPVATANLAANNPQAASALSEALSRASAVQLARVKQAADFTTHMGMGVLNAPPQEQGAAYEAALQQAKQQGIDTSTWPQSWADPRAKGFVTFNLNKAIDANKWFELNMNRPQPMVPGQGPGVPPAGGPGGPITPSTLHGAIVGQESGGQQTGPNGQPLTSVNGAVGIGQMLPETFQRYALPGETIGNKADNLRASGRAIDDFYRKYNGDPARVAVAYFSGEGNVAPPGSPTPWANDVADGNGVKVSTYVANVLKRAGGTGQPPGVQVAGPPAAAPAGGAAAPSAPAATGDPRSRGGVPMGVKGMPVIKDGHQLFLMPDGTQEWAPATPAHKFEDVKGPGGVIVGQRDLNTNQYHPINQTQSVAGGIDPELKGEEVYAALPAPRAAEIRSIVNGDSPIPPPNARNQYAQETRQLVFQAAGPGFTDALHANRMQMKKDMNTGKIGQTLTAQGTLFNHLAELQATAEDLKNTPYPVINKIGNVIGLNTGDPRVTNMATIKHRVNEEAEKYFGGSGAVTVSGLAQAQQELNEAQSPDQLEGAVGKLVKLIAGRQSELVAQINRGLQLSKPLTADDLLTPEAKASRDRILAQLPTARSNNSIGQKLGFGSAPPANAKPPLSSFQK
jgi:hypothetical protein